MTTFDNSDGTAWVVHDEKRMHLHELSDVCVICLKAEVESLRQELCDIYSQLSDARTNQVDNQYDVG